MRRIISAIFIIQMILMILGGIAMSEELVSEEYLREVAGISEEDVEASVLTDLIKRYAITKDSMKDATAEDMREGILSIVKTEYWNNYEYMFISPAIDKLASDLSYDSIIRIAVYNCHETMTETVMIDLFSQTVYGDITKQFLRDITQAKVVRRITTNEVKAIESILAKGKWTSWNSVYNGNAEYVGVNEYAICIETTEGLYRFSVSGADSGAPDELFQIVQSIIELA